LTGASAGTRGEALALALELELGVAPPPMAGVPSLLESEALLGEEFKLARDRNVRGPSG